MSKIDIRDGQTSKIDTIIFAETVEDYYSGAQIRLGGTGDVYLEDSDEDEINYVKVEDIPNLIKALTKAYEIWG